MYLWKVSPPLCRSVVSGAIFIRVLNCTVKVLVSSFFFFFPFFFSLPTVTFSKWLPFLSSSQSYLMDIQQLTLPPGLRKDGAQHARRLSSLLLTLPAFTFPSGFTLMLSPASEASAHHSPHSVPPLPTRSAAACHSFISTLLLWSSKVPSLFSQ